MIEVSPIGNWTGVLVRLGNADMIIIVAAKGFVGCGYFSVETAEKVGDALAVVRGVSSFEEVLKAKVSEVSSKAKKLGVRAGMSGMQALELLS